MTVDERFRALDSLDPPDLWGDAAARDPRRRIPEGRGRAVIAALVALLLATGAVLLVTEAFLGRHAEPTVFAPGPKANGRIMYVAGTYVYRAPGGGPVELFVENPDGTGRVRLPGSFSGIGGLSWSPDGKRVTFSQSGGEFSPSDVYVMNADGGGLEQITHGRASLLRGLDENVDPAWSPDGRLIAFASARFGGTGAGYYSIFVMSPDGSDRRRVTSCAPSDCSSAGGDLSPTWSPDGRRIAFIRSGELYVVNLDGSGLRRVLACAEPSCLGLESPSWSPDGRHILVVFGQDPHSRLDEVSPDGTGHRTIFDCVSPCEGVLKPTWSPDGTKI